MQTYQFKLLNMCNLTFIIITCEIQLSFDLFNIIIILIVHKYKSHV